MCTPDKNLKLCTCDSEIDKSKPYWQLKRLHTGKTEIFKSIKAQNDYLRAKMDSWESRLKTRRGYEPSRDDAQRVLEERRRVLTEVLSHENDLLYQMEKLGFRDYRMGSIAHNPLEEDGLSYLEQLNSRNCFDFDFKPRTGDILGFYFGKESILFEYRSDTWALSNEGFNPPRRVKKAEGYFEHNLHI